MSHLLNTKLFPTSLWSGAIPRGLLGSSALLPLEVLFGMGAGGGLDRTTSQLSVLKQLELGLRLSLWSEGSE